MPINNWLSACRSSRTFSGKPSILRFGPRIAAWIKLVCRRSISKILGMLAVFSSWANRLYASTASAPRSAAPKMTQSAGCSEPSANRANARFGSWIINTVANGVLKPRFRLDQQHHVTFALIRRNFVIVLMLRHRLMVIVRSIAGDSALKHRNRFANFRIHFGRSLISLADIESHRFLDNLVGNAWNVRSVVRQRLDIDKSIDIQTSQTVTRFRKRRFSCEHVIKHVAGEENIATRVVFANPRSAFERCVIDGASVWTIRNLFRVVSVCKRGEPEVDQLRFALG